MLYLRSGETPQESDSVSGHVPGTLLFAHCERVSGAVNIGTHVGKPESNICLRLGLGDLGSNPTVGNLLTVTW